MPYSGGLGNGNKSSILLNQLGGTTHARVAVVKNIKNVVEKDNKMSREIKEIKFGICHYDHPKAINIQTQKGVASMPSFDITEQNEFCHNFMHKETKMCINDILHKDSDYEEVKIIKCKNCFYFKLQETKEEYIHKSNIVRI